MSNTIGPKNEVAPSIESWDAENTVTPPLARPAEQSQNENALSTWVGDATQSAQPCETAASSGPVLSAADLAQAQAREARQNALINSGLRSVGEGLDQVVAGEPRAELALSNRMSTSPEFKRMLANVPREQVLEALAYSFKQMDPSLTDAQVKDLTAKVAHEVDQVVQQDAAQTLKKDVSSKLKHAADQFTATANSDKDLRSIIGLLERLESKSASPQERTRAEDLRQRLGLDGAPADLAHLKSALRERAALMSKEAERVFTSGDTTVYRTLSLHSGGELPGVAKGSWASQGAAYVEQRASNDEKAIAAAKCLSAVALGVASGGASWGVSLSTVGGVALGAGTAVAFNAGSLTNAFEEIDRAKAGVSAGTADSKAIQFAQRKAAIATFETVASGALGGAHAAHEVGAAALEAGLNTAMEEVAFQGAADAAEKALHPHGEKLQGTAIDDALGR